MNETHPPRRIGLSIGAVLAGFIVAVILSIGTDALMHAIGLFPQLGQTMSGGLFLLATVYRTVYSVVGSYITAWLAPYCPMKHALVGGAIGTVVGIVGAVVTWNRNLGPTGIRSCLSSLRSRAHGWAAKPGRVRWDT